MKKETSFNSLLKNPADDVTNDYLESRSFDDRVHSPLGQLLQANEGQTEQTPQTKGPSKDASKEQVQKNSEQFDKESTTRRERAFESGEAAKEALEPPDVDPVTAFIGGGTGGVVMKAGQTLAKKIGAGLLTGSIAATTEYPIGQATGVVEDKAPALALPFTVVTSLLSGVTIERIAEKAAYKSLAKLSGKAPRAGKVEKVATDAVSRIKNDEPLDDLGELVKDELQQEALKTQKVVQEEEIIKQQEEVVNQVMGDSKKPVVEIIPQEKGKNFLKTDPELKKHAININLARINSADDVKIMIDKTAKAFEGSINEARRGVQTNKLTAKLADDLNMHPADLLRRRQGMAFNAEEAFAARQILASSAERLHEMAVAMKSPNAGKLEMVAFRKQLTLHKAVQEQVSGMTAEAGRALQSFNMGSASTKQKLRQIDDIITVMGDDGKLTEQMADALITLDDPRAITEFVKKSFKATKTDVIMEAWINALLSGPQTQAVNATSNALVALWQIPERMLAAGFSKAINRGPDSVRFGEAVAQAWGIKQGVKDGIVAFGRAVKNEAADDIVGKLELPHDRAISAESLELSGVAGRSADFLGRVVRLPGTMLTATDGFYKSIGYRMELNARAYRQAASEGLNGEDFSQRVHQILSDPPDDIHLAAVDAARYQTFTNELTGIAKDYQNAVGKYPPLKVITPFVRTPTNIVKFFAERSPLAPLVKSFREDIAAGGSRRDLALARVSLGSSVMAISAMMAAEGKITGGGPVDKNLKSLYYDTGWQPYSIKVGDQYISYARLEPLGTLLGVASDFAEISGEMDQEDADKLATHLAMAVAQNVTSKTFLRGISELIQGLDDPVRYGGRYFQNLMGTMVPTGVAQVARINDPVLREVSSVRDKIRSRIPGFSKTLPPRRNLWGEPVVLSGGVGPDIISPLYSSTMEDNPVSLEMLNNRISISKPSRQIMGVDLTPGEYDFFVVEAGQAAKRILENEIKQPGYLMQSEGPDGGRSITIRSVILATREEAKYKTIEKFAELRAEIDRSNIERTQTLQPKQLQGVTVQ